MPRDLDDNIPYRDRRPVSRVTAYFGRLERQRAGIHEHPEIQIDCSDIGADAGGTVEAVVHSETGRSARHVLHAGEITILASGQPHSFAWRRPTAISTIYIDPTIMEEMREACGIPPDQGVRPNVGLVDPLMRELMVGLARERSAGFPLGRAFADAAETCLLARALQPAGVLKAAIRLAEPASPQRIAQVLEYIETHFAQDIGLDDMAAAAGLSRFHLAHAFGKAVGQAPYQYLLHRRIREAKRLLMTDLPLAFVADAVGFADQSHFTTRFRAIVGVTPGAFRKGRRDEAQ